MRKTASVCSFLIVSCVFPGLWAAQREEEDYFKKWLTEDVAYIISEEEEATFKSLATDAEKEQFIEQFWYRRDPNPLTAENEFKVEHYRRIAYANQWFQSGKAGWQTDRGRIYILYGAPDEKESYPTGGTYQRPEYQGGGFTSTHPFEIWRYSRIEGIGEDVELEFVDPVGGGEYRLTLDPEEKDALLHVAGLGLTRAESLGLASKRDRLSYSPRDDMMPMRAKDNLFDRFERFARVQVPQTIRNTDLREIVKVDVSYSNLPFQVRSDFFKLNEESELVPITLEIANRDLTYKEENGVQVARVAVYGVVTSLSNRIVAEFEDTVLSSCRPQQLEHKLTGRSQYQKIVWLPSDSRYKADLVIKDVHSGNIGTRRIGLTPHRYPSDQLSLSSPLLSDLIRAVDDDAQADAMFVLGNVWLRPSIDNSFSTGSPIGVYLQLYNASQDQSSGTASLSVRYRVMRGTEAVSDVSDEAGESVFYASPRRVVLIKPLPVHLLSAGKYRLEVLVRDRISGEEAAAAQAFEIRTAESHAEAQRRGGEGGERK